jgi:hypothetical protein
LTPSQITFRTKGDYVATGEVEALSLATGKVEWGTKVPTMAAGNELGMRWAARAKQQRKSERKWLKRKR